LGQNVQGTFWTTTTMTYWQQEGHKLHTVPEDERHPSPLVLLTTTGEDLAYNLWRLFRDKVFKVKFWTTTTMTYWQKEGHKLHTLPENKQHPPRLVLSTLNNHMGRCCLLYGDFSVTKRSTYILNHNNNDVLTKRKGISYTQCQSMNNILHALYYLQPQGKMCNFSGTKRSRYNQNNNDIMTIGLVESWRYNC
jgi:hypothetical protein